MDNLFAFCFSNLEGVAIIEYLKDARIRNAVVIHRVMDTQELQAYLDEFCAMIRKHFCSNDNKERELRM